MHSKEQITQLLVEVSEGGQQAFDRLVPLVYDELQRLARHHLKHERPDHTLNTTALVHEAYLKLVDQQQVQWQNRAHFFAVASMAMRRILVNYARKKKRLKRGGGVVKLSLDDVPEVMSDERADEIVALDEGLTRLAAINERAARVVECRFFGGLTIEETAAVLDTSAMTVKRDWRLAKTWLRREMG
jgi:RNA polymerase sigma factor (TIGR02999 family)